MSKNSSVDLSILEKEENLDILLNKFVYEQLVKLKNGDIEKPIVSDEVFLGLYECIFLVQSQLHNTLNKFQTIIIKESDVQFSKVKHYVSVLDQISKLLKDCIDYRVKKSEQEQQITMIPRVLRLARKLELKDKELKALIFIIISQAGIEFPNVEHQQISVASCMSRYCDMDSKEFLDFISQSRIHVKQNLIEIDTSYRDTLSSSILKMPKEVILALVGSNKIGAAEFLKIDKTVLSEILLEEPNFKVPGITNGDKELENGSIEVSKSKDNLVGENSSSSESSEVDNTSPENLDLQEEIPDVNSKEFDVYQFLLKEKDDKDLKKKDDKDLKKLDENVDDGDDENASNFITPYTRDIDYLDDWFQLLATRIKLKNTELDKKGEDMELPFRTRGDRSSDSIIRELKAKERMLRGKCEKRLQVTMNEKKFTPRLEKLAQIRNLNEFEKGVLLLLVAAVISHDVTMAFSSSFSFRRDLFNIGTILWILCDQLADRIEKRKHFYKNAPLIKDAMIRISEKNLSSDLMECTCSIDRRMLDYLVGLDSEFNEVVEGSHLYFPNISLQNVVLPENQKSLIVDTVSNFEAFKHCKKKLGFDDLLTYGNSLVMLFYGESGTGKTMMANALANHLKKKILLINFASLGDNSGEVLKFIFREAKINDSLLFFDECESIFVKREKSMGNDVNALLTEMERFDGLIILATNKSHELDEAMHRRITLAIHFRAPDAILRKKIWKHHFPVDVKLDTNVDFEKLAMTFELTGGLIKNAVLSGLSFAIARDRTNPVINMDDLMKGSNLQLRGALKQTEVDKYIVPSKGFSDLILHDSVMEKIKEIVNFEKARKILFSQWGFNTFHKAGTAILLHGDPGTGKSLAAEVIAYELGKTLKIVSDLEILAKSYSANKSIETLFQETKKSGAILVLEASGAAMDNTSSVSILNMLYSIEHFNGILIFITNTKGFVDESIAHRFKFVLEFTPPDKHLRELLWKKLIPDKVPVSDDIDFKRLASAYERFTGENVANAILRACSKAVLSDQTKEGFKPLDMKLLLDSAEQELKQSGKFLSSGASNMFQ